MIFLLRGLPGIVFVILNFYLIILFNLWAIRNSGQTEFNETILISYHILKSTKGIHTENSPL